MNASSTITENGCPASTAASVERLELIELARGLARKELMPRASALDASEQDAISCCWRTICEVGLDRALLPEDQGGIAMHRADLLTVLTELAVGDGGIALSVLLSNAALISLPAAKAAEVPFGARWTVVPVSASAERGATRLSLLGLGADRADGIVLAFRRDPCCSAIYAMKDAEGLRLRQDEDQLGLRGAPAASISLETSSIGGAAAQRPGGIGGGGTAHSCLYALLRCGAAAIANGIARRAEELAVEYALSREQGGVRIVQHDAVSDMLGAMAVRRRSISTAADGHLLASDGPATAAGEATTAGREAAAQANEAAIPASESAIAASEAAIAAKISATEAAIATCTDAVQVFGGTGYMKETGAEKLMRDAMTISLFPEPNWVALDELTSRLRGEDDSKRTVRAEHR